MLKAPDRRRKLGSIIGIRPFVPHDQADKAKVARLHSVGRMVKAAFKPM